MWPPSPPLVQRIALAIGLLFVSGPLTTANAEANANGIAWSIDTPSFEASPRSFPAIAIHLQNRTASPQTLHLHFDLWPLRSLTDGDLEIAVGASETKTVLYTLYVPPETPGGSDVPLRASADDGEVHATSIRIKAVANCKATGDTVDTRFLRPGEKAAYKIKIVNTGNIPLHCAIRPTTSPQVVSTTVATENLVIAAGGSAETAVEVATGGEMADFISFVTSVEIDTAELSGDAARQFFYFHTEAFPQPGPPDHTQLFETLKASVLFSAGVGSGNRERRRGADGLVREALTVDGMIADNVRLQFIQAFAYPSDGDGDQSSALSAFPGGSTRNYFHLGLYSPQLDLEAGEVTTGPARLLSSREIGDGFRVAWRPDGNDKLQIEAFAEENTLTLNRKDVFGALASGTLKNGPLEFWRAGTLSKRGDIGPQGRDWDTIGVDTGWKISLAVPVRAEFSAGAGEKGAGHSGFAWLAGLHYNRVLQGELETFPFQAGVEFASGDKDFPGAQNGRDDQHAYLSFRFSTNPTDTEAYANYNNSDYSVVPNIEKTLDEEQSLLPDFLLTSQSRLINAGVRWNMAATPGAWHLPSGNAEFQETRFFNKSDFFDKTNERAVAINIQPFDQRNTSSSGADWHLGLLFRGGTETRESDGMPERDSQFLTFGTDLNYGRPAPAFLDKIGGPGRVTAELSGHFTVNLDGDTQALNRTGVSMTAVASWLTDTWSARGGATLYSYANEGLSDRVWASITRKVAKGWWAGIEAAYTRRGNNYGGNDQRNESAMLLTFRHDFEIPVPWLPRRGQVTGQVFDDLNNNGRHDPGEPGLERVKVAVGRSQAVTGPGGEFSFPPMAAGDYQVTVSSPVDAHFNGSSDHPTEKTALTKGAITQLTIGMNKPTTCEGQVRFRREHSEADVAASDKSEDLSGLEIISTDSAGRIQRSATRADGFFAIYLAPGTYDIKINPSTLKTNQAVSPANLTIKVERSRIENLAFTVTERTKQIRKTFVAKTP
jgi:hypothetical protein